MCIDICINWNISLTWNNAIWGWFHLLAMIPRSQWGRYRFPWERTEIYIYIYMFLHMHTDPFRCGKLSKFCHWLESKPGRAKSWPMVCPYVLWSIRWHCWIKSSSVGTISSNGRYSKAWTKLAATCLLHVLYHSIISCFVILNVVKNT